MMNIRKIIKEEVNDSIIKDYIKKHKFWTVGDLRRELSKYPDDMLIGNTGHFGEYLQVWDIYKSETYFDDEKINPKNYGGTFVPIKVPILKISIENAGEEPD